ncbi:MAG: SHOCT domain-containing protein [Bacilli bacterium]|nr:SHOCT domain-containing protein [Bacilli bacterium]MDD3305190.1 SHOCT domain-containing protein [Bacilli bacterium]MDD4053237.1 SHOCT domain-containing protein [Bacilli bacterium]MDD4411239.1 SHOCT domain-containing protein [Bacilli bacterium]
MEKSLLKISGIIAIVLGIFMCITIFLAIVGIFLIIGGSTMMGYTKLSDKEIVNKKNSILGWSIFFLFFSFISGVLGLIFYFTMDNNVFQKKTDYVTEIKKLAEIRKQGLISEEEYTAKKKKILDI